MLSENILRLYKTMQMGFVFFLRMFQDKCNRDCNCDYVIIIDYIGILFNCNRAASK